MTLKPIHIDLQREEKLTVHWPDGRISEYPIAYLRRMSPSAETKQLREEMARNPLAILPQGMSGNKGPLTATEAELVGNYAIRIRFSDGHDTGLYSWTYLREIDPQREHADASPTSEAEEKAEGDIGGNHDG